MPRIAVFTKNRTNPAYEAARLGADRTAARLGATTIHYVPEQPDSVPEQIALIARAIAERPDAAVFVPVDETAVNDAILGFDVTNIPLFNIITRTTAGRRVTFVGSDDRALARNIASYLFGKLPRRSTIIILEGTPPPRPAANGCWASRMRWPSIPASMCEARSAAITSATSPATFFFAPRINGRASARCCAPTMSWLSACWMRSMRTRAAARWSSASTPSPKRSPPSRQGECSPPPTSTPWR